MLNGIDISNWNSTTELRNEIAKGCDFVMMKATEGATYTDKKAEDFLSICVKNHVPVFFYHFFRSGSEPEEQMHNFLSTVDKLMGLHPTNDKVGLVIDFEIGNDSIVAMNEMLMAINQDTGARPLIYCSESKVAAIGKVVDTEKYGLWVAKYSNNKPNISPWNVMAFWQYTDIPLDRDRFYGTREQLGKYMDYSPNKAVCLCNKCSNTSCGKRGDK